ncbi:MAG: hypothetical protein SNI46_03970, partial [Rikenellaceae bacterium]
MAISRLSPTLSKLMVNISPLGVILIWLTDPLPKWSCITLSPTLYFEDMFGFCSLDCWRTPIDRIPVGLRFGVAGGVLCVAFGLVLKLRFGVVSLASGIVFGGRFAHSFAPISA